ncbi:MAG: hypothetical protein V2A54_14660 [Bacteroidota bacterium]
MKKHFFILLFFLPLISIAQDSKPKHDTLILDRFFQFVGKQCKKVFAIKPIDSSKLYPNRLRPGFSLSYMSVVSKYYYLYDAFFIPSLTFNYKRSSFAAGLRFYSYHYNSNETGDHVLHLSYKLNPSRERRFLNFFLFYDVGYYNTKRVSSYPIYSGPSAGSSILMHYTYKYLDNHIGYGIKLSFSKYFYLFQFSGLGFYRERTRYTSLIIPSNIHNITNTELTGNFSLGLGFRFRK